MSSGNVIVNQPGVRLEDATGNEAATKDTATITPASQPVIPIAGVDGTTARTVRVDSGGRVKVQADALPLPTGAATETKLEAVRALVASLDGKDYATQATLATLATEAKLEQVRTLLATIDADTGSLAAEDFATEVTLAALLTNSADIETILAAIRDTAGIKKITDGVQLQAGSSNIGKVFLEDGLGTGKLASVDGSNRLAVTANVVVPAASVSVNVAVVDDLTGLADTVYVVPSGKVLTISRFAGGSEGNSGKVTEVSLYDDPLGTGAGMTLLRTMFLGTSNYEYSLDHQVTGDGTFAIRMRRDRLDGAADRVAAFWDGYRDA